MEDYIEQIEKYQRGQMTLEEEGSFKNSLKIDAHLRSYAFIMTYMLREQKAQ